MCKFPFLFLITFLIQLPSLATIIAFSGLSGTGKTTMAQILAQKHNACCVTELEESNWPQILLKREIYGFASGLLAFRQMWAQQFIDADILSKQGKLVFLDTYFFKIFGSYLGKPGMDWLINPHDPYLQTIKQLHELDRIHFPDADYVILFEVSLEDWKLFLQARGRNWDQMTDFVESYTLSSNYIAQATKEHCTQKNIPLVVFQQKFGNADKQAHELRKILQEKGLL